MIFVILGIIILIVSFAVALISLVREQTKFEKQVTFHPNEPGASSERATIKKTVQAAPEPEGPSLITSPITSPAPSDVEELNGKSEEKDIVEETSKLAEPAEYKADRPFWEQLDNRKTERKPEPSPEERTIEQIKAELKKLTQAPDVVGEDHNDDQKERLSGTIPVSEMADSSGKS